MTESTPNKNSFRKLKKSILSKVAVVVLGSLLVGVVFLVFFVDGVFQNSFAAFMIGLFKILGMNTDDANFVYYNIFMSKKTVWMLMGLIIIMAVAFYISLTRFTKYFDEISDGVDELAEEKGARIKLSPELDFMEDKLNEVSGKLRKRERDAKDAEQRKNDLVVYLAHDIKTPLTSVIGYLNLLKDEPDMPIANRAKYSEITLEKAYRLEELINEFFDITRFNLQTIVLDKTKIDIELLVSQVVSEFYPIFEEKGLTDNISVEDGLTIQGDSQKLARVINNIIRNAALYSHKNQPIIINGRTEDGNVILDITDTGEVIPQGKLDAIFEKFYRLDQARSTNTGGSGLGLAIAKEIVLAHGGQIFATSNYDKTTFTITLPKE